MHHHEHHKHGMHPHGCLPPFPIVGKDAPAFEGDAVLAQGEGMDRFGKISLQQNMDAGKWTVLFFYPLDFTFVCPTEIKRFNALYPKFKELNAEVVGCSTDSIYTHLKWQETELGNLQFPHMADTTLKISRDYGVLNREEGIALRGTFIISPQGELYHYSINHGNVGRNVEEVLRLLEACQSAAAGNLMPCEWHSGENTL